MIGFRKHTHFYVEFPSCTVIARSEATWQSVSKTFRFSERSMDPARAKGNGLPRQSADWLAMTRNKPIIIISVCRPESLPFFGTRQERISYDHTIYHWHSCVYRKTCSFRVQSRLGNREGHSVCDWTSRAADCVVYRRVGHACGPTFDPCAIGSIPLAGSEKELSVWRHKTSCAVLCFIQHQRFHANKCAPKACAQPDANSPSFQACLKR